MSLKAFLDVQPGLQIPQIGLGTWQSEPDKVKNAVTHALNHGYRHLDLAKVYANQHEVAAGIQESGVDRKDIFLTSKLWNCWHRPDQVAIGLEDTLQELKTDYLDLYLIHWPVSFAVPDASASTSSPGTLFPLNEGTRTVKLDLETSLVDTWKEMIKLKESGKVKAIGVSNFTIEHIEGLIKATGVVPAVNQIERHPLLPQDDLVKYCQSKNILVTAYSPLGNNLLNKTLLIEYPEVKAIAQKLEADPAQVLIAWGARGGISVIPKSVNPNRIESNFKQIELSDEDHNLISQMGNNNQVRFNVPVTYNPVWDINVFDEEAEKSATHKVKIQ